MDVAVRSEGVILIGYHASHEQFSPRNLLAWVQLAEAAGFQGAMCSDHFHPWAERHAQSGFAWSWMGAAMQATGFSMGTVNAPGQRYHPAIIAQASATLAQMFPDRFWFAVGSGEYVNEHITGGEWPPKAERNARLLECVQIMRALWAGETVTHQGLVTVENAKLYSRPERAPTVYAAALSPETARWAGSWSDGLITVAQEPETTRRVLEAYREGGGEGKPASLQVHIAFAPTDEEARAIAWEHWRENALPGKLLADASSPAVFEKHARVLTADDLRDTVRMSSDLGQHRAWLAADLELGFDRVYLHEVGPEQDRFIEAFGAQVLPKLKGLRS